MGDSHIDKIYVEQAKNSIAKTLKLYRAKNNLNQTELAQILSMHLNTVHRLENEQVENISFGLCLKICNKLNVSFDSILGLQKPMNDLADIDTDKLLQEIYRRMKGGVSDGY